VLRRRCHPTGEIIAGHFPEVSWHGVWPWQPDWSVQSRLVAMMLYAADPAGDDCVYVAANAHWEAHKVELPALPDGWRWHLFTDTGAGDKAYGPGTEPPLAGSTVLLQPRSTVVLVARTHHE
jgi:glycogen operon protein